LKIIAAVAVTLCGAVLVYGTMDFPAWSDPASPAATHVSPHYIEKTMQETSVPNIVTAVLADYRGYDTMFETAVIFSAGIACLFLLRVFGRREDDGAMVCRHIPTGITVRIKKGRDLPDGCVEFERIDSTWVPHDIIVKNTCRLVAPFIQLFALYVVAHGHHSPGGGFQGGVIFGAAVILYSLSYNLQSATRQISERAGLLLSTTGIFIYAGTGALCLLLGSNFLNYGALAGVLGVDPVTARSHGILIVEIGVGVAVSAVMVLLFYMLASIGRLKEGL
jgi:multicomponent Na+:H+ antiporter subunit B